MATFKVYCDESRQTGKHRFRLVGSVWVRADVARQFVEEFRERCQRLGGHAGHLTFKKNTPPRSVYMRYYEALVDLYFEYAEMNQMSFRTIVVARENFQFDHPMHANGDFEIGLSQLYYHLLVHWLTGDDEFHIRIAERGFAKSSPLTPAEHFRNLLVILNNGYNKLNGYPDPRRYPVKSVEPRPARARRLIQLTDVLMGAVGYHWNEEHLKPGSSAGKTHLASYIARKLGWKDLRRVTAKENHRFNIFHFRPEQKNGAPSPNNLRDIQLRTSANGTP